MRRLLAATLALIALTAGKAAAQVGEPLLDQGFHDMYNQKFSTAHQAFAQFQKEHPDNPLGPAFDAAAYLFGEFERLHILQSEFFVNDNSFFNFHRDEPDLKVKAAFDDDLAKANRLADAKLKASPQDADGLFAKVTVLGLHSDFLALIERRDIAALGEVKEGQAEAQKLLASHPTYYDAYIASGVENYLLSQKPAPIRWLLHFGGAQTDKKTGIDDLKLVSEKGHYLLPYARLLLAIASLRDGDKAQARMLLSWLSQKYPDNVLYRQELAKLS